MVAESWFRSLLRISRKHEVLIGVLAFEVASLMSKLIHLWQSLSDKQVVMLREEIMNSVGVRKLISEDDENIVGLISAELIENLGQVARVVTRLSKKCSDPLLKSFKHAIKDLIHIGGDPYGWQLTWKKMGSNVKKMERLIVLNSNLYQDIEALGELEETARRMKSNDDASRTSLVECQKKVAWKQQEVKHVKGISLWNRTYNYTVLLLARSIHHIW